MADIEIEVDSVETRTAKATLFIIEGREVWVPESCIKDQCGDGDEITSIFVSEYFATQKGLI